VTGELAARHIGRECFPCVLGSGGRGGLPIPRHLFEMERFHPSRSLRKRIRRAGWTFTVDRDFEGVMCQCAEPTPTRPTTWITGDFVAAYTELHRRGAAHRSRSTRRKSWWAGFTV